MTRRETFLEDPAGTDERVGNKQLPAVIPESSSRSEYSLTEASGRMTLRHHLEEMEVDIQHLKDAVSEYEDILDPQALDHFHSHVDKLTELLGQLELRADEHEIQAIEVKIQTLLDKTNGEYSNLFEQAERAGFMVEELPNVSFDDPAKVERTDVSETDAVTSTTETSAPAEILQAEIEIVHEQLQAIEAQISAWETDDVRSNHPDLVSLKELVADIRQLLTENNVGRDLLAEKLQRVARLYDHLNTTLQPNLAPAEVAVDTALAATVAEEGNQVVPVPQSLESPPQFEGEPNQYEKLFALYREAASSLQTMIDTLAGHVPQHVQIEFNELITTVNQLHIRLEKYEPNAVNRQKIEVLLQRAEALFRKVDVAVMEMIEEIKATEADQAARPEVAPTEAEQVTKPETVFSELPPAQFILGLRIPAPGQADSPATAATAALQLRDEVELYVQRSQDLNTTNSWWERRRFKKLTDGQLVALRELQNLLGQISPYSGLTVEQYSKIYELAETSDLKESLLDGMSPIREHMLEEVETTYQQLGPEQQQKLQTIYQTCIEALANKKLPTNTAEFHYRTFLQQLQETPGKTARATADTTMSDSSVAAKMPSPTNPDLASTPSTQADDIPKTISNPADTNFVPTTIGPIAVRDDQSVSESTTATDVVSSTVEQPDIGTITSDSPEAAITRVEAATSNETWPETITTEKELSLTKIILAKPGSGLDSALPISKKLNRYLPDQDPVMEKVLETLLGNDEASQKIREQIFTEGVTLRIGEKLNLKHVVVPAGTVINAQKLNRLLEFYVDKLT